MTTSEAESARDLLPPAQIQQGEGEASVDKWGDLKCPLRGPKFPFGATTRDVFDRYFKDHLNTSQDTFNANFEGSDKEKSRAEETLRDSLLEVVARDAWRAALTDSTERLGVFPAILAVLLCLALPWLVAGHPWWNNILTALAGFAGAVALVYLVTMIGVLVEPRQVDGNLGNLIMVALSAGLITWLYQQKPMGWVFLITAVTAFGVFIAVIFAANAAAILTITIRSRVKVSRYLHAELSDCVLIILEALSRAIPDTTAAAGESYYAAKLIEQRWQHLTVPASTPAAQRRVQDTIRAIAAGMRDIGFRVTFPTKISGSQKSFEAELIQMMAKELTALTTCRYGDLIMADEQEAAQEPWARRVLRGLRSVIAAFAPVILLLVLPKAFNFTISANLYGTLLTVSLAWLALYVVGWLDPKALANVSSLPNITSVFKPGS